MYDSHPCGLLDASLFHGALAKAATDIPLHIVTVKDGAEEFWFVKSSANTVYTSPELLRVISGMGSKKREAFSSAAADALPFRFGRLGDAVMLTNATLPVPNAGNVAPGPVLGPLWFKGLPANDYHHSSSFTPVVGASQDRRPFPTSVLREILAQKDLERLVALAEYFNARIIGSMEEPLDLATASADVSANGEALAFIAIDEFDGDQLSKLIAFGQDLSVPTVVPLVVSNKVIDANYGDFSWDRSTYRGFAEQCGLYNTIGLNKDSTKRLFLPKGYALIDEVVDVLQERGLRPTGRVVGLHIWVSNSRDEQFFIEPDEVLRNRYFAGDFLAGLPFFGPGRGYFLLMTSRGVTCYELEQAPRHNLDAIVYHPLNGHSISKVRQFNSIWNGGVCSTADNMFLDVEELLRFNKKFSDDGMTTKEQIDPVTYASPLEESHEFVIPFLRSQVKRINGVNVQYRYLSWKDVGALQGTESGTYTMIPLVGMMHGVETGLVGMFNVISDESVLTDYSGDPIVPYVASLERPPSDGEGVLGGPAESGTFEDSVPSPGESTMRTTRLRYTVIEKVAEGDKGRFYRATGSALSSLISGQGYSKPLNREQSTALQKVVDEMDGRALGGVYYTRAWPIPTNVTDRLSVAVAYRKAREKACLLNDWDKQEYVKGVTYGAVKKTMNSRGEIQDVYNLVHPTTTIPEAAVATSATSLTYIPGSSPAKIKLVRGGDETIVTIDNQDLVWEAYAAGTPLSGISITTLASSWGVGEDATEKDGAEVRQAAKEIGEAQDYVRAGLIGETYVFDEATLAIAGFPDIAKMPTQNAWKTMIASVILHEKLGAAVGRFIFEDPARAIRAYIADALVRLTKRNANNAA